MKELWDEAQKQPLYGTLHDMSVYLFTFVNSMAEMEEATDESKRICDIKPMGAVFKITEIVPDKDDHTLNVQIGHLIGKRTNDPYIFPKRFVILFILGLQEFDALNNSEINDFRFKMRKTCDEIAISRSKISWLERLCYYFPPRISPVRSEFLSDCLQDDIFLSVKIENFEVRL